MKGILMLDRVRMVAKRKIKNFSRLSYSMINSLSACERSARKHCVEPQNSIRRMISSSGNLLPAEGRAHHSVRAEKSKPRNAACSP